MVEQQRREWEEGRSARAAALALGPVLRDPAKAMNCHCSCHPQPASTDHHDGGATCSCQLTREERAALMEEFLNSRLPRDPEVEAKEAAEEEAFDAAVAELGVEVEEWGGQFPFTITGVVDGRAFYLRSRHDQYRVEVASDEDPLANPSDHRSTVIRLATGSDDELEGSDGLDPVLALRLAVDVVRMFQQRRTCEHVPAEGRVHWCPYCGERLQHP